jgi:BirA family transcriptional regulator, biotin operon repressor / biotin---[acetyl-CoA-carboxylase] ligase
LPLVAGSLDVDVVRAALLTRGSPWREVEYHSTIGSTNARAAALGRAWRVVLADHQSAGRGRLTRTWQAPPGTSVAVSASLPAPGARQGWLPLMAGLAVGEAVTATTGLTARLKWPNDVLLPGDDHRKVCGVLCEVVVGAGDPFVVVGAGINVDQSREQLPVDTATSLRLAGAQEVDRDRLVAAYLTSLARHYSQLTGDEDGTVRDAYRSRCDTLGRTVTLSRPGGPDVQGTAVAVDDDGRLVIDGTDGRRAWAAGDVTHVRSAR